VHMLNELTNARFECPAILIMDHSTAKQKEAYAGNESVTEH
jgi:hypothetical protein